MSPFAPLAAALLVLQMSAAQLAAQEVAISSHNQDSGQPAPVNPVLAKPAGLLVEDVQLADALVQLRFSSGVPMAFSPSILPSQPVVTCRCQHVTLAEALDGLLDGFPVRYAVVGQQIVIEPTSLKRLNNARLHPGRMNAPARFKGVSTQHVEPMRRQQTGTITGRIVDASSGQPIAAVQVNIAELEIGALTQADGRFLLTNVPAGNHVIHVQRIGYRATSENVTVRANESTELNIRLQMEALALDAVVVTGTAGQARRREIGNTISEIRMDRVIQPVANVDALLQGRVPGMSVMRGSGAIGSGSQIRLRGNVSVAMSNQPLIYIDGVRVRSDGYPRNASPTERQDRGPNDTGSPLNDINPDDIERIEVVKGAAATTLYGTEAAAGVIQIFTRRGMSGAPVWTAEVTQGFDRVLPFAPSGPKTEQGASPEYLFIDPWLRTGWRQGYRLSVRGGVGDEVTYFLSGSFEDNQGVYPLDEEERFTVRGNLSFQPWDILQVQWNTSFTRAHVVSTPAGNNSNGLTLNAFRRDRNFFGDGSHETISRVLEYEIDTWTDRFITGFTATFSPTARLSNRYTVGYDLAANEYRNLRPYGFIAAPNGILSNARWTSRTLSHDYVGNFQWLYEGELRSRVAWGAQLVSQEEVMVGGHVEDLPGPGAPTLRSGARQSAGEDRMRVITGGIFFQNTFDYRDRYFLTAGVRVDGNSAFGRDLGLQAYPKVSGSYVISDESFWREGWGTLRLRAAYGHAGRAPGAFDAVRTWDPVGWRGLPAFRPGNVGNPQLGPERTAELEFGFEGAILDDRLAYDLSWYRQRTTDALFNVRQIPSQGFTGSQLENVGELENKGIELTLAATLVRDRAIGLETGISVATNHSKVLDLGGAPEFSVGGHGWIVEGQPIPVIRTDRIMNPDEIAEPIVDEDHYWGPNQPTHIVTGFSTVTFPRNIQLSLRGEYQGGHYMYDAGSLNALRRAVEWPTCFNANDLIAQQRLDQLTAWERSACITANVIPDWFIYPADFFRLREVSLRVPVGFAVPLATSATLTLSARDFWTWKNREFRVFDPEMQSGAGMFSFTRSITEHIPPPATFTAALRVTF